MQGESVMDTLTETSVLIVDDSSTNIKVVCNFIRDLGHRIHIAKDGVQALKLLTSIKPTVIIMDAKMPNMDGFECCRRIKQSAQRKDIPVLFMSGSNDVKDMKRAQNVGASEYITKPIDAELLRSKIDFYMPFVQ